MVEKTALSAVFLNECASGVVRDLSTALWMTFSRSVQNGKPESEGSTTVPCSYDSFQLTVCFLPMMKFL